MTNTAKPATTTDSSMSMAEPLWFSLVSTRGAAEIGRDKGQGRGRRVGNFKRQTSGRSCIFLFVFFLSQLTHAIKHSNRITDTYGCPNESFCIQEEDFVLLFIL